MNLNEMFPSNYLSKDDFPAPRMLVMIKVTKEELWRKNGKQVAAVLHFQGSKPMVLNKTNAVVIARIYGTDTAAWVGKPIEIFHDPNVMLGRDRVGGVRVKLPTSPRPAAGPSPIATNGATPKPVSKAAPPPIPQLTLADKHAQVLAGFAGARTAARLDEWARWAHCFEFTQEQDDDLSDAYHAALERIAMAQAPTGRAAHVSA